MKKDAKKTAPLKEKMLAYVTAHPGMDRAAIAKAIGCQPINVSLMGSKFVKDGIMEYNNKTYSIVVEGKQKSIKDRAPKAVKTVVTPPAVKAEVKPEAVVKVQKHVEETEEEKQKNFGRDFGKYDFQGEKLRKGAWVLAAVQELVKKNHNITYKELLKILPASLVRTFGVIVPLAEAKKANAKGRIRYCTKHSQLVQLKEGSFAVTNQISSQNFDPIVDALKAAGIKG